MKKNLCMATLVAMFSLLSLSLFAQIAQPKTVEYPVQGRKNAIIKKQTKLLMKLQQKKQYMSSFQTTKEIMCLHVLKLKT